MAAGNAVPSDVGFSAYRTAVHEAGHALGLSNFSYRTLGTGIIAGIFDLEGNLQPCEVAHPTIPDSVMNYDGE